MNSNPLRTYGRWRTWDGKPLAKKPLFYQGVDNETADVLTGISDDIQKRLGFATVCSRFGFEKEKIFLNKKKEETFIEISKNRLEISIEFAFAKMWQSILSYSDTLSVCSVSWKHFDLCFSKSSFC